MPSGRSRCRSSFQGAFPMPRQNRRPGWPGEYRCPSARGQIEKKLVAVGEILRADALQRCAKTGKRRIDCLRVFGVRFYEKVHVLREARLRVINNREPSHKQGI